MSLIDRIATGLDALGRKAGQALDEGKLRMEVMRLRRHKDRLARDLGYLVYQQSRGAVPPEGAIDRLTRRIGDDEAEIERLEEKIRDLRRGAAPPPPPPHATTSAAGSDTAPEAPAGG
jgi:hypothetical protein